MRGRLPYYHEQHSEQGIAIVIVLVCIIVLSAMAAIFAAYMKVEMRLAANSNNESRDANGWAARAWNLRVTCWASS